MGLPFIVELAVALAETVGRALVLAGGFGAAWISRSSAAAQRIAFMLRELDGLDGKAD